MTPLDLMATWATLYDIKPRSMIRLLEAGRLVLVSDGFDEMAEAGTADQRVAHFGALWRFYFPGTNIIFAGRDHFLRDGSERKAALGIETSRVAGPYAEVVRLVLFDSNRIGESLRSFPKNVRKDIVAKAVDDSRFCDIVARPSLAYVVGRLSSRQLVLILIISH